MNYKHLTLEERYQIAVGLKLGLPRPMIASMIKRDLSTLGRELRRNASGRGYDATQAHALARARMRARANAPRISDRVWAYAEQRLGELWSPEQIAGRAKLERLGRISHESIYQRIYADKRAGGTLHLALRCQKPRRIRYGAKRHRRGVIRNAVSIDQRPAIVDQRRRFGDWETDLMFGLGQREALLTLNERKSRFVLIRHLPAKTSLGVSQAITEALEPFKALVHTLTSDNGTEFACHEHVAKALCAKWFFAHPYSSWERGANENHNGLIRQFFPKKLRFQDITADAVQFAIDRLNNRPRKCLRFKTPHEVFTRQLHSGRDTVALQT